MFTAYMMFRNAILRPMYDGRTSQASRTTGISRMYDTESCVAVVYLCAVVFMLCRITTIGLHMIIRRR